MKAIVMAAGKGTRMFPFTNLYSKHLMCIYDKPVIYYSVELLLNVGVEEIAIVCSCNDRLMYENVLEQYFGKQVVFNYIIQDESNGIGAAFQLCRNFIGNSDFLLMLGDNYFNHKDVTQTFSNAIKSNQNATIFAIKVEHPEHYGVVTFDADSEVIDLVEKPLNFISDYAIPGLYIYSNSALKYAENLKMSDRGEFEITDINKMYLEDNLLKVIKLSDDTLWLDVGNFENLFKASEMERKSRYEI